MEKEKFRTPTQPQRKGDDIVHQPERQAPEPWGVDVDQPPAQRPEVQLPLYQDKPMDETEDEGDQKHNDARSDHQVEIIDLNAGEEEED